MKRWEMLFTFGLAAMLAVACTPDGGGGDGVDPDPGTVQSVSIQGGDSMLIGERIQLQSVATYEDGTFIEITADAEWTSSDEAVAVFDPNQPGQLEAIAPGSVEVVVIYEGVRSEPKEIAVAPIGVAEIRVTVADGADPALERGESLTLAATAVYDDGAEADVTGEVEWRVGNESVAQIEGGVFTALRRGSTRAVAAIGDVEGELEVEVVCPYPEGGSYFGFGQTAPNLSWNNAYQPDGTQMEFGMEAFFCDPEYDDKQALIIKLGAGWCSPCTQYTQNLLNPIADSLEAAGAQVLYIGAQDYNYNPSGSDFTFMHIGRLIGEGAGIRVGDADSFNNGQPARAFVQNQPNVDAFPQVWVVRKRDMQVIADQGIGQYYLPLPDIVADVEADWSNPPPYRPPFVAACDPEDEEIYEPNDTVLDSGFLQPGSFEAGLCTDPAVDFYSIGIQGAWRLTVEFQHSVGDIDMVLWDKRTDAAVTNANGEAVGSFSTNDQEVIDYFGPADVQVYGYNNASGLYTVTLEEM